MEYKLFGGEHHEFASAEWYKDRESAPHLEQPRHRERLLKAMELIELAISDGATSAVDLGCGDGGLLSLMKDRNIRSWGYDLAPSNVDYATHIRGVDARYIDFKNDSSIEYADIAILTEVLEHLEKPHETVIELPSKFLVASVPWNETDLYHYEFHLWAWDLEGFAKLITDGGYVIQHHEIVCDAQILLGVRP